MFTKTKILTEDKPYTHNKKQTNKQKQTKKQTKQYVDIIIKIYSYHNEKNDYI